MGNNNGVALVALSVLGVLAIIITGKFLLESKNDVQQVQIQPMQQPVQNQPVAQPLPTQPTQQIIVRPEYHSRRDFWVGYNDGWALVAPPRLNCAEYLRGYDVGLRDRQHGRRDYYNRHCPPGLHIRVPSIQLNFR